MFNHLPFPSSFGGTSTAFLLTLLSAPNLCRASTTASISARSDPTAAAMSAMRRVPSEAGVERGPEIRERRVRIRVEVGKEVEGGGQEGTGPWVREGAAAAEEEEEEEVDSMDFRRDIRRVRDEEGEGGVGGGREREDTFEDSSARRPARRDGEAKG